MNDRDRLAADLAMIRTGEGLSAALVLPRDEQDADRLIALGWTRLDAHRDGDVCTGVECGNPGHGWSDFPDEERLARALHRASPGPTWRNAAAIAKAYREDADARCPVHTFIALRDCDVHGPKAHREDTDDRP